MLVAIEDLAARLSFVMDEDEEREALGALEDLSFDAQTTGSALWQTAESTPQAVKNLIVRAAARHMKNHEGYTVSRAGDETVQWAEQDVAGQATFTADEKRMLRTMGGTAPFIGSVGTYAYGMKVLAEGMVPVAYAPGMRRSDFPLYASEVEPW